MSDKYHSGAQEDSFTTEEAKDFFETYHDISPHCKSDRSGMQGPGPSFEYLYQAFKKRMLDEMGSDD